MKTSPELEAARADADVSLAVATRQRDHERRKLKEEQGVVESLQREHAINHLADLATQALRQRRT